jgi:hypothetical protein
MQHERLMIQLRWILGRRGLKINGSGLGSRPVVGLDVNDSETWVLLPQLWF